ncbi:DUF3021 family protein [Shouchella clausii]|nr:MULTISPECIES: DUF3021 family protein [Shouchella]MBU3232882.1 DUF3021 domain-containing protein [Shouchella clausii]MBU3265779.1 DUF3021 domain-containing protein [Shouchella clausii]MBU3508392.1 DUF3021 domain-containing protein [Shouchella clausii]MBU3534473.1 DUF3021 domain-containing protein [Shouchella clausii]MBX0307983.1 DUF3021 domain-containing protein [Shouchella clausii]
MQLFFKGLIRGLVPFVILLIISIWNMLHGSAATAKTFLFYSLVIFFLGLASVIYQIKQWSFIKQIIVHYMAMLITVFPVLLLYGSYPLNSFMDVLKVYFHFNEVGLILFISSFLIIKLCKKFNKSKEEKSESL